MIPILFSGDETLFRSNGLGRLTDTLSCLVTEERNGTFEAEFTYPVNGTHYADIEIGTIIFCTHDASKIPQPFEIYKRSAEIDGVVTYNAHHISYRLNTVVSMPFALRSASAAQAMAGLKSHAVGNVPFNFYSDKTVLENFKVSEPKSIRQVLAGETGSLLDVYGTGEYKFDCFQVWLYVNRGSDRGVSIRYGKNMQSIKAERSAENRYTAVVPYWVSSETGEVTYLPEMAVIADQLPTESGYWTDEDETIFRQESGEPLEFDYQIVEYMPLDLSDQWETQPTEEELRAKAVARLEASEAWETDENITVSFTTDDSETQEALSAVCLCDTVGVFYPALGVEVKKKVIKTVYNTLLEAYDSIELGTPSKSLFETLQEKTSDMMQSYVKRDFMAEAIDRSTMLITGGTGGYIVLKRNDEGQPEEFLAMDADNTVDAKNVIRINKNGIGFSTSGYNGPFRNAWTIDGAFNTAFINVESLSVFTQNAGEITAGVLRSKDYSYTSGTYTDAGIIIDLDNKLIRSTKYAFLPDGTLNASDAHLMGSIVARDEDNTKATVVNAGDISFYLTVNGSDVMTSRITPMRWSASYSGTGNSGVSFRVNSAADYISLGYDLDGNRYAALIINKTLNPNGHTEKVIIADSLRATARANFNKEIYAGDSINSCKNVLTSSDDEKKANRIGIYYDSDTDEGILRYYSNASGTSVSKTIVKATKTGEINYSGGKFDGAVTLRNGSTIDGYTYQGSTYRIAFSVGILTNGAVLQSGYTNVLGGATYATGEIVVTNGGIYAIGSNSIVSAKAKGFDNAIWMLYNTTNDVGSIQYRSNASGSSISRNVLTVDSSGTVKYAAGMVNGVLMPAGTDGNTNYTIGTSGTRWYQVWSTSFNLTSGVYINYNSANDYIYASKTIHQASDEALKNIYDYDTRLDELLEMPEPITYTWKDSSAKMRHAGLGARRTKQILDSLGLKESGLVGVDLDENGKEVYSVDYMELAVMLLHAVQGLKQEIAELKKGAA